jgi:hypothetical protein
MRRTSIEAYAAAMKSKLISYRARQVYECLYKNGPITQNEAWVTIAANYPTEKISKPSITPRFSDLARQGLIAHVVNGKRICGVTGVTCMTWDVTDAFPKEVEKEPTLKEKYAEALLQIAELKAINMAMASRFGGPKNLSVQQANLNL